jgi:hypothetical protein
MSDTRLGAVPLGERLGDTATVDAAARTLVIEEPALETATGGVKIAPAARVVRV